jgi:hypothetical protein
MNISKSDLRKEAYKYISEGQSTLPVGSCDPDRYTIILLSELALLKEGSADPSAELVTSLKQLLEGTVAEAEIDVHLVVPFEKHD